MRFLLIAGDPSGDQHGAKLMKALKAQDASSQFLFFGGDAMESVGGPALVHLRELAFMGFSQLLGQVQKIRRNFRMARESMLKYNPDAVILIDYAGFNLRMARWAWQKGYRVFYYIPPKVWAWRSRRVIQLRKYTHRVFCILPFESSFLQKFAVPTEYVGSPVIEDVAPFRDLDREQVRTDLDLDDRPVIALLPGSRKQEISRMLPLMSAIERYFPDYQFVVACHPGFTPDFYKRYLSSGDPKLRFGQTLPILRIARAALVTSGTATLETALMEVPQVVCYKTQVVSYLIARWLIRVRYISLVNLILDKPLVNELIQSQCRMDSVRDQLNRLLAENEYTAEIARGYRELHAHLGDQPASQSTAGLILKEMQSGPA